MTYAPLDLSELIEKLQGSQVMMGIRKYNALLIIAILFISSIFLIYIRNNNKNTSKNRSTGTLHSIKKKGKITVIMTNNANVCYNYRGEYIGFEYDLVKKFAEFLGVKLEVIIPEWDKMFQALNSGKGDMIAAGLTISKEREKVADFSNGYLTVEQEIIIHRNNKSINNIKDLNGKKIHIRPHTSYEKRLKELKRNGLNIDIIFHKNTPTEELIRMVAKKKIEITVADSNIAKLNWRYYPDIKIAFPISKPQQLGWAVRKNSDKLLKKINEFFKRIKENGIFRQIYERYYGDTPIFDYVDIKKFQIRLKTRLPKYKDLIKKSAEKYGFDWRLIAAIIYQESHFNPYARSYTGVRGLMQVTQRTARAMGIRNRMDPAQSVKAGVGYLAKLYNRFDEIDDPKTRILFALASYNIGYGHVRDAQKICREKGWEPDKWSSLKKALPLLRVRKYYKNTKYGYARGTEPVRYIRRIIIYYDILKQKARE